MTGSDRTSRAVSSRLPPLVVLLLVSLTVGLLLSGGMPAAAQSPAPVSAPRVIELHIADDIEPIVAEYITEGIDQAAREHAALVLITMDTPGGLQTRCRRSSSTFSPRRCRWWCTSGPPPRAAPRPDFSFCFRPTLRPWRRARTPARLRRCLPSAAFPISVDETLKKKILNDATAFLRSYADKRGRNVALAETAVTEGKAFSDVEAKDGHLMDLIASSPDELLAALDGRTITRFDGVHDAAGIARRPAHHAGDEPSPAPAGAHRAARRIFHPADSRRRSDCTPSSRIPG